MERFWYRNGQLKEEGQWFNNRANGLMRSWDEKGKLSKAVRYKNGDLIEVLRQ
jgi:antitoxin component YwqK of YwqJK toxin-antitoxin module